MGMGLFGLLMVIIGVFIKGDVKQTLLGLFGGMFYWMGAIDFLFMYYANRFGTQAQLDPVTGEIVSRPEYLILPSTFGFWAMTMMLYLFCTANGCNFLTGGSACSSASTRRNRRTPHDTPYQHCRFYGSHYHAVDVLLGADVLLR